MVLPDLCTQVGVILEKKGAREGNLVSPTGAERREEMLRALREAEERWSTPERVEAAPA
jgi:hypothetical protein